MKISAVNKYLLISLSIFLSGCGTLLRVDQEKPLCYYSTRTDWGLLTAPKSEIIDLRPLYPVIILDMPFAVVLDTLLLPVESYYCVKYDNIEKYWGDIINGKGDNDGKVSNQYFNDYAFLFLSRKIGNCNGESLANLYDALIKIEPDDLNNKSRIGILISYIAKNVKLQGNTYDKIFSYAESNKNMNLFYSLASNSSTPDNYYQKLYEKNNMEIMENLFLYNKRTPDSMKKDIEEYSKKVLIDKYEPNMSYYKNKDYYLAKEILDSIRK